MAFLECLAGGFRIAARHRWLIPVLWLAPLVPALVLVWIAASNIGPVLGRSLFADGVLHGDWFVVWSEFRSSPADALDPLLGPGIVAMVLVTLIVQVVLAAGVVEVVLETPREHPFVHGIRANAFRFARSACLLIAGTVISAALAGVAVRGFFKLAEARSDGRLDLVGVVAGVVVFLLLWAPQKLAADLSRISAVRHHDRSMTFGYLRSLAAVLARPGLFASLIVSYLVLVVALHAVYGLLRSPWTPASLAAVFGLLVVQQVVMLTRAVLKLGLWGSEVAAFRAVDEPRWCRPRTRRLSRGREEEPVSDEVVVEGGAGI